MAMVVKRMAMVVKVAGWRDISMVKSTWLLFQEGQGPFPSAHMAAHSYLDLQF